MWLRFLAFMITMYVVLDGFDIGVGALHLLLGGPRTTASGPRRRSGPSGTATRSG